MHWMRGKIPVCTSVAVPPCPLIAHWIRFHWVCLLVCECSCSGCVCVCVFSGWRSMAVAAFFFPLKIWSRNVSLTDYPQCFSPTQGPRLARRLECVCVYVWVPEGNSAEVRFILPEGWSASVEDCGCFWRAVLSSLLQVWDLIKLCCTHPHACHGPLKTCLKCKIKIAIVYFLNACCWSHCEQCTKKSADVT